MSGCAASGPSSLSYPGWRRARPRLSASSSACIVGALLYTVPALTALSSFPLRFSDLIQTCAVARCAGTLVNLRKPLCNLGSVFAAEIHGARVVLQSCWHVLTDSVGAVVEVIAHA